MTFGRGEEGVILGSSSFRGACPKRVHDTSPRSIRAFTPVCAGYAVYALMSYDALCARARNPYSPAVVMDSGLAG